MVPRSKAAFWGLVAASLALMSIPSITLLETCSGYVGLLESYDGAVLRPTLARGTSHPDRSRTSPEPESGTGIHFVEFRFRAPQAKRVDLAADFTHWERHPVALKPGRDGSWEIMVPLPPGSYRYRYMVDGLPELDPAQPQVEGAGGRPANLRRVP